MYFLMGSEFDRESDGFEYQSDDFEGFGSH